MELVLYDVERSCVRIMPRETDSLISSIFCRTEDRIATFLFVIVFALDFSFVAFALPPIGTCDEMVSKCAAIVVTLRFSPLPAHFCVKCSVVSRHRHIRTSSSSRRWRRYASLPGRSGRFMPTKDIVGCTRGRKTCSARLHGRLVVPAGSKVVSRKHAWVRSGVFC